MLCLEEGMINLPPPIENFHVTYVDNDKATFIWNPLKDVDQYEIYYKKLDNNSSPASAFEHDMVRLFKIRRIRTHPKICFY